jgi:membrane-associated phospholipid phosphatase
MIDNIKTLFYNIGQYSYAIFFFLSIFLLRNKSNYCFYYIIGIFVNCLLNVVLKQIFRQPRPSEDPEKFKLLIQNSVTYKVSHDVFGMPSGHAQFAFFSTAFIYFTLLDNYVLLFYLFISLLTLCQRVIYKYHTIFQVIVGSLIGGIFGYFVFQLSTENLKGDIREKMDEDGHL